MRPQVKRIILFSIILIAVGGLGLGAGFYFLYLDGVQARLKKLDDVNKRVGDLERMRDAIPKLQDQVRMAEVEAVNLKIRIPPMTAQEFDNFIRHIHNVANETLVYLAPPKTVAVARSTRGKKTATPKGIEAAAYELDVSADFKRLQNFLGVLERAARFVTISQLSFTPTRDQRLQLGAGKQVRADSAKLSIKLMAYAAQVTARTTRATKKKTKPVTETNRTTLPPD